MQIVRFVGIIYIRVIASVSSTNFPSKFNKLVPHITMIKNASRFLPDWVRCHRRIGIDRFYVFDNNSTDLD